MTCPENCRSRSACLALFVAVGAFIVLVAACLYIIPENAECIGFSRYGFSVAYGGLIFFPAYLAMKRSICQSCK